MVYYDIFIHVHVLILLTCVPLHSCSFPSFSQLPFLPLGVHAQVCGYVPVCEYVHEWSMCVCVPVGAIEGESWWLPTEEMSRPMCQLLTASPVSVEGEAQAPSPSKQHNSTTGSVLRQFLPGLCQLLDYDNFVFVFFSPNLLGCWVLGQGQILLVKFLFLLYCGLVSLW